VLGHELFLSPGPLSIPWSQSHRPDVTFACAQLLWVLAGADDAASIGFYNPRAEAFADETTHLSAAVGPRLGGGRKHLLHSLSLLREDPSTRRAIIPLVYPADLLNSARDFPCGLALQFFLREGALDAVCFMRSQSALMVMPYDLVLFRGIQHVLASELDVPVGQYIHLTSSMHIYEEELAVARSVADEPPQDLEFGVVDGGFRAVDECIRFETTVRLAVCRDDHSTVITLASAVDGQAKTFWDEVRIILLHKAATTLRLNGPRSDLQGLLSDPLSETLRHRNHAT
jgi:thymidylate synthase